MKTTKQYPFRFLISSSLILILLAFGACSSNTETDNSHEVQEAKEELDIATLDLEKADNEFKDQYIEFKNNSDSKLIENENAIAELKLEIKNKGNKVKDDINKEVEEIEKKIKQLKIN